MNEDLERRIGAAWDRIMQAIEGALVNEERDVLMFLHRHAHTPDIVRECAGKIRKQNSEHSESKGRP